MFNISVIIVGIIGYLLGSINSSIIVSKLWGKTDIRKHGSGNAGATNTLRTLGKGPAIIVLLGDVLKGIIAVVIGQMFASSPEEGRLIAGFAAVLGHNYPLFFGFKGGKGILTSAAVIMVIDWRVGLILLAISLAIMAITKYVSLGSIVGSALYPLITYIIQKSEGKIDYKEILFAVGIGLLAIFRHHANIKRLLDGTESKLGSKSKVK